MLAGYAVQNPGKLRLLGLRLTVPDSDHCAASSKVKVNNVSGR
jgi:hypothetical protein